MNITIGSNGKYVSIQIQCLKNYTIVQQGSKGVHSPIISSFDSDRPGWDAMKSSTVSKSEIPQGHVLSSEVRGKRLAHIMPPDVGLMSLFDSRSRTMITYHFFYLFLSMSRYLNIINLPQIANILTHFKYHRVHLIV